MAPAGICHLKGLCNNKNTFVLILFTSYLSYVLLTSICDSGSNAVCHIGKNEKHMYQQEIFNGFVAAINRHDLSAITSQLTDAHRYTDAAGAQVHGKDPVAATWKEYFVLFPDYKVEVAEIFVQGEVVLTTGRASGTFAGQPATGADHWSLPASWRLVVNGDKVAEWQVFMDGRQPAAIVSRNNSGRSGMPGVTGLGGVFFKCADPEKTRNWYHAHLGLVTDKYGTTFEWRQTTDPAMKGFTQWSPFKESTKYFEPSQSPYMINYRVAGIETLVDKLREAGVTITDAIENYEYGKFVHILDCDGNKVELWEPNDSEYEKILGVRTF